jgi:hypothetical protein
MLPMAESQVRNQSRREIQSVLGRVTDVYDMIWHPHAFQNDCRLSEVAQERQNSLISRYAHRIEVAEKVMLKLFVVYSSSMEKTSCQLSLYLLALQSLPTGRRLTR